MSESEQSPAPRVPAGVTPGTLAGAPRPGGDVPTGAGAPTDTGPTGDPGVDAALRRLQDVEEHDLRRQAATFDEVHAALQARLADAEG